MDVLFDPLGYPVKNRPISNRGNEFPNLKKIKPNKSIAQSTIIEYFLPKYWVWNPPNIDPAIEPMGKMLAKWNQTKLKNDVPWFGAINWLKTNKNYFDYRTKILVQMLTTLHYFLSFSQGLCLALQYSYQQQRLPCWQRSLCISNGFELKIFWVCNQSNISILSFSRM